MRQNAARGLEPKRSNKIRTVKFISARGITSKTEISSSLKLSMPTTLQNVKALVEEGIVEETGDTNPPEDGKQKRYQSAVVRDMPPGLILRTIILPW